MERNELPFGTQFTPNVVDLRIILQLIKDNEGAETGVFIDRLVETFFSSNAANSQKTMAGNCKNSLVAYGILKTGGGIHISEFGDFLYGITDDRELYDAFARHILKNFNGLVLIDTIRKLNREGIRITNESVIDALNKRGFNYKKTANNPQSMKLWLEKAGVLAKWRINENKLTELIDLSESEIELLKELRPEQYYFLKALCNTGSEEFQKAADIRDLATATYGITFQEKAFGTAVLNPLEEKGLIEKQKTTEGRGAKTPKVRLTELTKRDIVIPLLEQMSGIIGEDVSRYYQKTLQEIRNDVDSTDTYIKGLALEALAIKIMGIIGLDFIKTRLKGSETGGAEVDVLFDSSRLLYSRWQVQCKNTSKVSLDQVAKEVGLSHVLRTNAIVIMTTGTVSESAREYANKIMRSMNLCIIFIEGSDIDDIIQEPTKIVAIFNRESLTAKHIKVLEV